MNNVYEKYLPVGTVVRLKNGKRKIMITGFCVSPGSDGNGKMYDYSSCLYPEGLITSDANLLFDHDQIEEVVFKGFENEEEKIFKDKLKQFIAKKTNLTQFNNINNEESISQSSVQPVVQQNIQPQMFSSNTNNNQNN